MGNRIQQVAAEQIASHLDYLRDFGNLDEMTHQEIAEALAARFAEANLLVRR